MDNIIEPKPDFDFSKITLVTPVSIQGGAYFTKILYNDAPLYIQTPKSLTRQGFVKNGKKYFCDLMFDNEDEDFITWIENLENKCQKIIYDKSKSWFETTLEINDIESAFNSSLKLFKSGKYYLLRSNIKTNTLTNVPYIKIFNENETIQTMEDVKIDTTIVSIIEIQGIKFTTRNFQIEFELKQVMLIKNDLFFESCLIKKREAQQNTLTEQVKRFHLEEEKQGETESLETLETKQENKDENLDEIIKGIINEETNKKNKEETNEEETNEEYNSDFEKNIFTEPEIDLGIEDLNIDDEKNNLKEIDFTLSSSNDLETISLKKPNEVYYEIYKQARKKAKEAKKTAILAYLEARNIKKTYMLDDIDNSDSDNDSDSDSDSHGDIDNNQENYFSL